MRSGRYTVEAGLDNSTKAIALALPTRLSAEASLGGQLQFLGKLLFFGTGDGGSGGDPPNNAQNKESLLGKLLRIAIGDVGQNRFEELDYTTLAAANGAIPVRARLQGAGSLSL